MNEREAFEARMRKSSTSDLTINRFGNYRSSYVQNKWNDFQAGYKAAIASQKQQESKILSFDDNGQLVDKSQAQQPSKNIADVLWGNKALMALNADLGLSMDQLVKVANAILQSQAQQPEYTFDQLTKMMMQAATKEGHKVTMRIKWAQPPAPEGGE